MDKISNKISSFYKSHGRYPFITFEGLDGAGKTTLANKFCEILGVKLNFAVPDDLAEIKNIVSKTKSPLITFKFFSFCNSLQSFEFKDQVKKNVVVADRYLFSTITYHQKMLKNELRETISIFKSDPSFLWPDLIFFVTADSAIRDHRMSRRPERDKGQWYGDSISLKYDLENQYKNVFNLFDMKYLIIDNGNIDINSSLKNILKQLESFI